MNNTNIAALPISAALLASAATLHALPLDLTQESNLHSLNDCDPLLGRIAGISEPVRFYGGQYVSKLYGGFGGGVPATDILLATCMADVNGDGNADIVSLRQVSGSPVDQFVMATHYGYAAGFTAGPRETFTLPDFDYGSGMLEAADMNRDGFPDIVLLARTWYYQDNDHVAVFFNGGNIGRFNTSVSVTTAPAQTVDLRSLAVLHANSDDYPDIVLANRATNTLTIYLNNAANGFTASPIVLSESLPERLWVQDIDRDGKPDLVVASGNSSDADSVVRRLSWRKFQGLSFAAPVQLDSFTGMKAAYGGMAFADVNDNGTQDVVFARNFQTLEAGGAHPDNSTVWSRAGTAGSPGVFASAVEITSAAGYLSLEAPVHGLAVADFDRDGDNDLFMSCGARDAEGDLSERIVGNLRVHGDSAGVVANYAGTSPAGITSLTTADVNGDSWTDLVAASAGSHAILWYPGLPAGGFGNAVSISTGTAAPSCVVAADLDHDGHCDLAWAQASTGEVKRAFNSNKVGTSWGLATLASVPGVLWLTAGNANADADIDLVTVAGNGAVTWHYNGGDGDTWTQDTAQTLAGARQAAIVKVDTNLRKQLAAASIPSAGNPALMNVKNFNLFATPQWETMLSENGAVSGTSAAVTSGDFDRDGNPDIAWAAGSNEVKWRNPVTTVNPAVTVGTAPGTIRTLRCMDWNSDGWDDLLCAHSAGVSVWLRKSSSQWTLLNLYTGGDCSDAVPIHIDHDSHMDVAAVDAAAGMLKLITHGPVAQVEMTDTPVVAGGASLRMDASQSAYVLRLDIKHLGNERYQMSNGGYNDDAPLTLSHLRLRFVKAVQTGGTWTPGIIMTAGEAAASIDKVLLVKESTTASNPTLDVSDTILAEAAVSLSMGYVNLTVNNAAIELKPRDTARYYIALKMKPTVSAATTGRFFVQHITAVNLSGSRGKALGEYPASVLLNTAGTDSPGQLINITTGYDAWRMANFGTYNNSGTAGDLSDGDKDGLTNLSEYVLQRNPLQADAATALKLMPGFGSSPLLRAELPAIPREDGIITIQQSSGLDEWTTLAQHTGNGAWTGSTVTSTLTFNGITYWNLYPAAAQRTFFRIQFSVVP